MALILHVAIAEIEHTMSAVNGDHPLMRPLDDEDATLNRRSERSSGTTTPVETLPTKTAFSKSDYDGEAPRKGMVAERVSGSDQRHILTELECYDEMGFSFSTRKKWTILSV